MFAECAFDQLSSVQEGWLVGCFGLNDPLRQYFSLYRAVSQREGERREVIDERKNVQTNPPPAPTASAIGPCPTIIQSSRTPRHWKFTQHLRTTRPPLCRKVTVHNWMLAERGIHTTHNEERHLRAMLWSACVLVVHTYYKNVLEMLQGYFVAHRELYHKAVSLVSHIN